MINNLTNNTIPHRENNDLFEEVQAQQLKDSQLSSLMDSTSPTHIDSPRNITQVPYDSVVFNSDHNVLAPPKCIRQINEICWRIGLAKDYGKEFILIQNTMYSNMQLHFIVKDKETQKYKKWYLSLPKEEPIVDDMKFSRKDYNDLWEYIKSIRYEWTPYNGGEFTDEEINFATQ
jgi:hypothetical protein